MIFSCERGLLYILLIIPTALFSMKEDKMCKEPKVSISASHSDSFCDDLQITKKLKLCNDILKITNNNK